MTWDPLDGEVSCKLDERAYVSLSHDRRLASAELSDENVNDGAALDNELEMSLFDIHMPGVLTLPEVLARVDLDHWLLLVHGTFVHFEDLVRWETSDIRDPQSLKGIVGELAAVLGPELVKHTAVVLFD
jgi:arginine-tRNA-protein transferase